MLTLSPELKARLATPLQIGSVTVNSRVLQSPLAGVTDLVFRRLVRRYAPDSMMYTEMVSASGLHYLKTLPRIMEVDANEHPISIQLFDCRPDFLAEAAIKAVAEGADTVDINMGCPVNKITKNGGGSSLLRDVQTAATIVRTVSKAVPVPVTVKTRIGWSDQEINILDFAKAMEDAGAAMITVHGRTRAQGFTTSSLGVDCAGEGARQYSRDCQWRYFLGGSGGALPRANWGGWGDVLARNDGLSLLGGGN